MSDLEARHRYLEQLGIQVWYPRKPLADGVYPVPYTWHDEQVDASAGGKAQQAMAIKEPAPVRTLVRGLTGQADATGTVSKCADRSEAAPSAPGGAVNEPVACCLGIVRAGAWGFVFEAPSETDLLMDLAAVRRVAEGISDFAGWSAPEAFLFVWPPLSVRWQSVSLEHLLRRFAKHLEGVQRSIAFFGVEASHRAVLVKSLGLDGRVQGIFDPASELLERREGKRMLWHYLKARQG